MTTKDTFLEIIRFRHGKAKFYLGFLLFSPFLVLMKLGILSNQLVKEMVMRLYFGSMKTEAFNALCEQFAAEQIPSLLRSKALQEIEQLKRTGAAVVIVSASAENWLGPWCAAQQLPLLATQMEVKNGRITGRITGKNCHGEEKVRRIRAAYQLEQYKEIYCYGDTSGDKPMLALAHHAFYQPFR